MRFSLVNPAWNFEGSLYFGCREPHLPLEYGYSKVLLEEAGHDVQLVDAQLEALSPGETRERVAGFQPDFTVVTSAPSYLFWRCPPPELRVPQAMMDTLRDVGGTMVAIGPHASTTPEATLLKLDAEVAVLGECEEVLPKLPADWGRIDSIAYRIGDTVRVNGKPAVADMSRLPTLHWSGETLARHRHHHHRFDQPPSGPGAEMEASRGYPYHCTFCAKDNFRNSFRRRPLENIRGELEGLIAAGAQYVYFIDEIFLPFREVLEALRESGIAFGIQTRIDLWTEEMIDLLGDAGCVSIEAGVESISESGGALLDKKCGISTADISDRLIRAKQGVAFVQANLFGSKDDDPADVLAWRVHLREHGVWAHSPVPLLSYPGSPGYPNRWGATDERAWERAHEAYLADFNSFSDIHDQRPLSLTQLETLGGTPDA